MPPEETGDAVRAVHHKGEIAALLNRDPALHAYELGDLDDQLWPYTTWYRMADSIALLYRGAGLPTLLALDGADRLPVLTALVGGIAPVLPEYFHAQVTAGAEAGLAGHFDLEPHGLFLKMTLTDHGRMERVRPLGEPLGPDDLDDLLGLYRVAYPGGWFQPRMLANGPYFGVRREDGTLVAVAGSHIWSPDYRVAALGNVATHPDARGQGLGTAVVARWCRAVAGGAEHVALNVKADNPAAVRMYERLGFTVAGRFTEFGARARASRRGNRPSGGA